MFGQKRNGAVGVVSDAAEALSPYADQLAHDEKLRQRLAAAIAAGIAARQRARRQAGVIGVATRIASDQVLRAQVAEAVAQLRSARKRVETRGSHKTRNFVLFLTGAGMVVAAMPNARSAVIRKLRETAGHWSSDRRSERTGVSNSSANTVVQEIEVDVPVSTAYNQWTQFEEFPKFMEGVDEVKQLDDTLLHWAATVAGKKAEWDAKIVAQEPDRRIAWESVDGKRTRGTVTFDPAGPSRTRIRLNMSYAPDGVAERVGSAAGLDDRRVRGDLERFRDLIEARRVETGAWRGKIEGGETADAGTRDTGSAS